MGENAQSKARGSKEKAQPKRNTRDGVDSDGGGESHPSEVRPNHVGANGSRHHPRSPVVKARTSQTMSTTVAATQAT